jgi:hypothetical protein
MPSSIDVKGYRLRMATFPVCGVQTHPSKIGLCSGWSSTVIKLINRRRMALVPSRAVKHYHRDVALPCWDSGNLIKLSSISFPQVDCEVHHGRKGV